MAINQNHTFEDFDGVKCAIVEKNVLKERIDFLKTLLDYNGFTVVILPSPPPKTAPVAATPTDNAEVAPAVAVIETFTIGVTDVMFNATNAIFGRLLHSRDGHVVTLAFWEQLESSPKDEIPYYENK